MFPVLMRIPLPSFLTDFFPSHFTIYGQGFFIALGILLGYLYAQKEAKEKFNLKSQEIADFFLLGAFGVILGGKLFLFLDDPSYYWSHPSKLLNFSKGYVFYGSFLVAGLLSLGLLQRKKIPVLPALDSAALFLCLVHFFARLGCFMAGCCYGKPYDGIFSVAFSKPLSSAPSGIFLYPTQIMSMLMIAVIGVFLFFYQKKAKFSGEIFFLYLISYGIGRFFLEFFRGDKRGFVFNGLLSNSQLIAVVFVSLGFYCYFHLKKIK